MKRFSGRHAPQWDEYQWEREIRRDECRIANYFRELACCLDLPDEEELICGQLAGRTDLVPAPGHQDALGEWLSSHGDDEPDDEPERPRRPVGASPVDDLDLLASEWNLLCASKLRADLRLPALGVACAFGKLLARTADFIEPEHDCEKPLLISLGKRALADLNELTGMVTAVGGRQKSLAPDVSFFVSRFAQIREMLLAQLSCLRG